jgi:hypothetical protein
MLLELYHQMLCLKTRKVPELIFFNDCLLDFEICPTSRSRIYAYILYTRSTLGTMHIESKYVVCRTTY